MLGTAGSDPRRCLWVLSCREGTQGALLCIWFAQTPSAGGQQQMQVGQSCCYPCPTCPSLVPPIPTSAATHVLTANKHTKLH